MCKPIADSRTAVEAAIREARRLILLDIRCPEADEYLCAALDTLRYHGPAPKPRRARCCVSAN